MKALRCLGVSVLLVSAAVVYGVGDKISFRCEAGTLENVLTQLSKATGVKMKAGSNVEEETVLLAVKDCTLEQIKDRLAQVTHAHWKQERDLWVLARTPADEQKLREEDRNRRAEEIRDCLREMAGSSMELFTPDYSKRLAASLRAKLLANPNGGPYLTANDDRNKTPAQRALMQIVTLLDPADLVIQPGDKIAYSNKPKKLELQLPIDCSAIIQELIRNQNTWSRTVSEIKDPLPKNNELLNPFRQAEAIHGNPTRVLLTVTRGNSMAPAVCNFYLLEDDGGIEAQAQIWLTPKRVRDIQQSILASSSHAKEKPIEFSDKSKKLFEQFKALVKRSLNGSVLPREFVDRYSNPEQNDLLSYFPTDALHAISEWRGVNVVADLTDLVVVPATISQEKLDIDPPTYLNNMLRQGPLKETDESGWLLLEPLYPVDAAYLRTHRKALGEYLRSILRDGYEKVDECGKFAWTGSDAPYQGVSFLFANLIDPTGGVNHDFNWASLRIWGALTDQEREALYAGKRLPLLALSDDASALVLKQLLKQGVGFYSGPSPESERFLMNVRVFEAVEALPNGFPKDGYLQLHTTTKPAFFPVYDKSKDRWVRNYYDLSAFARELDRRRNPRPEDTSPRMPELFRIGNERQLQFDIVFGQTGRISATFAEVHVDQSSAPMSAKELPEDIKKLVEAERTQPGG